MKYYVEPWKGGWGIWLRRTIRRPQYVIGVDVGLDGAETTCKALFRLDGTIEVIEIIETTPIGAGESSHAPDGSAVPEVLLTPGQTMAQCPVCKGLWTKDCKPGCRTFPDDRIMPTGPHCPHCGATVRIFIDLPNAPRQTAERSGASLHADVGQSGS
jgi:hypothetical protein